MGYYFDIVQIREQDKMMGVQENYIGGGDVHSNKRKLNEVDVEEGRFVITYSDEVANLQSHNTPCNACPQMVWSHEISLMFQTYQQWFRWMLPGTMG